MRARDDRGGCEVAETGHLVFGTLHTTGAARTVDRIVDAFPASYKRDSHTIGVFNSGGHFTSLM